MSSTLTAPRSNMAAKIKSCSPRDRICLSRTRHSRGYCWGTRYRWSHSTYPKSLESHRRSPNGSDDVRVSYASNRKSICGYNHSLAVLGSSRASSSWGGWTWDWDKSIRKMQAEIDHKSDPATWSRNFHKLDRNADQLFELIKKRIDADPFVALFGQSLLHPNRARATWWGFSEGDRGSKREQCAKVGIAKNADKQHADQTSKSPSRTQCESTSPNKPRSTGSSSLAEEYEIDLINMRKIPKGSAGRTLEASTPSSTSDQTFEIPVKRFEKPISVKPCSQSSETEKTPTTILPASQASYKESDTSRHAQRRDWLSQEGFGSKRESGSAAEPKIAKTATMASPTRLESALERHMRTNDPEMNAIGARSSLKYEPKENQTDDVDLLRASDIRAASGAATRLRQHAEAQKHERRMKLENDFAALQRMKAVGLEWKKELADAKIRLQEADAKRRIKASDAQLQGEIQAQRSAMEAMEMRRAGDSTSSSTVMAAHPEPGEGDMASNVHEFVDRDRWYKRKAPHATTTEERNSVQIAKDKSLVREIRGIYEDKYGAIDTKHRQLDKAASNLEEQKSTTSAPATGENVTEKPKEIKKATKSNGPLSTQEKIGTMLQQLLDDSRYLQKLLQTPELSSQSREELFHRNHSIRNASDAIAEALSSTSPISDQASVKFASIADNRAAINDSHERSQLDSPSNDAKKPSTVYNVLAYDPSIQQVTTAEMSSSGDSSSERRLSLSEALSSLTDPVKFLPQLTRLQSQGFEIVSSDTNILVLKRNCKPQPVKADAQAALDRTERHKIINPIDGTTTWTGKTDSPQGFVGHNSEQPGRTVDGEEAESSPSGYKVRREEDVFSGSSGNRWNDRRGGDETKMKSRYRRTSRRRRTTKRMLWVGLWTAGCCYAVGRVTELLRA